VSQQLKRFVLTGQASLMVANSVADTINNIQHLNWQGKAQKQEASGYVNRLIHQVMDVKGKLAYLGGGSIPKPLQLDFIACLVDYIANSLV